MPISSKNIEAQLSDAIGELRNIQGAYELDPAELERVDQRLGALHDAARKYQTKPHELADLLERLSGELESLETGAGDPEHIAKDLDDARAAYDELAQKVSTARDEAAISMSLAVNEQLPLAWLGGCPIRGALKSA